jgi:hypothetical protein
MVPLTALPAIFVIFWGSKNVRLKLLLKPLFVFGLIGLPWFFANLNAKPDFINNYFRIGLPGVKTETNFSQNFQLVREYLHNGIGKWFWPGVISLISPLIFFRKKFIVLVVLIASIMLPFLFSAKAQIWHMIPAYPFLILLFFGFGYNLGKKIIKLSLPVNMVLLALSIVISLPIIRANWYNFIDVPAYISDEQILAQEASNYSEKLYLDDDSVPAVIFYSNKTVSRTDTKLSKYFDSDEKFLLITREYRLPQENIDPKSYEIIKKDRDKLLVRKI